jgi:hypothetical protein
VRGLIVSRTIEIATRESRIQIEKAAETERVGSGLTLY